MIQEQELLSLCDLARIGRSSIDEKGVSNINDVIGYMKNLDAVPFSENIIVGNTFINSVRNDDYEIVNESTHELLISNFPETENSYNRVQKILNKKK